MSDLISKAAAIQAVFDWEQGKISGTIADAIAALPATDAREADPNVTVRITEERGIKPFFREPLTPATDAREAEAQFMAAVWAALKADATDLGKQQRILAAFRALPATDAREKALREAAEIARKLAAQWWSEYKDATHEKSYSAHHEGMSDGADEVADDILRALEEEGRDG